MKGASLATLITVRNLNRALRFYTKSLGAKVEYRGEGAMRNAFAALQLCDAPVWLIVPEKVEKRKLAYSAFLVKNIRRVVADLQQKKVKFTRAERMGPDTKIQGPIAYEPFGASAFFKDTEGNLLMLYQNIA